ncbi:zinc finger CCCH domain-containing protein 14 [Pelobates fuscus]|uniref:zinc finger CCCH domain-containing protein 14 n=1 Tax=Pelobates fuscus TaxID=191477 RepID=UPI002FE438F5
MEIGTEISRKIRTAIKGKLQELGAYVDEELPDYIMVMVANKKSQEQMTDDLSLFLGNNTARFTTWLQGVLDKLRSLTPGTNNLKTSEAIIFESAMPPLMSFTQSLGDGIRDTMPLVASSTQNESVLAARLTSAVKPLCDMSQSEAVIDIKLDVDDPFNDDITYVVESELYSHKRPPAVSSFRTFRPTAELYKPPGSGQPVYHATDGHISLHRQTQNAQSSGRPITVHTSRANSPLRLPRDLSGVPETYRAAFHASSNRLSQEEEIARKRKVPIVSSVVKIKKRATEGDDEQEGDEEEEEEEDYMSHAGISSSVSVPARQERRPTLPPSKQANKNLILKAISEAQESVTKTTNYSIATKKQMVPVAPRTRLLSEEELKLLKSQPSMLYYQTEMEQVPEQIAETRRGNQHRKDLLSRLQPDPEEEAMLIRPEPVDAERLRPTDSRSFILKRPKLSKDPANEVQSQQGRLIQPRETSSEKPGSPKFIVTLDGVPSPPGYGSGHESEEDKMSVTEEWETYPESCNPLSRPEQKYTMQLISENTPKTGLLMDVDGISALEKMHERCRYWPACKNAEVCVYHHPTVPCKAFPNCRFADKCFFIHPNCKYDAKCTKAECPYTHASKRIAVPLKPGTPPATQKPQTCRFFPVCKNTECTYFHPKLCRFNTQCTRPDCKFYHPSVAVPPRHALTWTRSQASD